MGWLRRLFFRERVEADLDKELRFHFDYQVADKVRTGIPESEARRLTRLEFGGIEQIKEDCRERRGTMWLESLLQDVRYALRQLRKAPGFTLTAVLTLALGIGATTAIFTLVQQVMLQSLPVARPDQLWRIGDQPHCCNWAGYSQDSGGEPSDWNLFPWEAYKLFRANTTGFQDLAALQAGNMPLAVRHAGSSGPPDTANGQYVSGNFFETLGVPAWRGRLLIDADDQEGAPPVAVMSFHAWQEKYGSDPSVAGSTYEINGRAAEIAILDFANPRCWVRSRAKVSNQAAITRVARRTPAGLAKGRACLLCAQILLQMKEQNSPKRIAFPKVALGVRPATVTELNQSPAIAHRRDLKPGDRPRRIPRAGNALPLHRMSIRLQNFPLESRTVLGVDGEAFTAPVLSF